MALLRQSGQPIDLFAAVPKVGVVNPRNFQDAFDERQDVIAQRGPMATAFAQQRAQALAAQRFQQQQQNFQGRHNSGPSNTDFGHSDQPVNGKFWMDITGGKYKPGFDYGHYPSGGKHNAYDFLTPMNSKIFAPTGGKIISAGWEKGGFGNAIRIQFNNGVFGIIGHLGKIVGLKPGMIVSPGQLLALSGNTGNSSGPHTHFETRYELYNPKTAFDPARFFGWH